MLIIFSKVLVVFIYIGIGFAANKLKVLPDEAVKYFIDFIMKIAVPCMMISSITGQELDGNMYRNTIHTFIASAAFYVIIMILTSFLTDRFFKHLDQDDKNVLASAMTGCNSGFMGFPVAKSVFGPLGFYYIVIQNVSNNIYLFILSIIHLHHNESVKGTRRSVGEMLKPFANPATIATALSIVMLFAKVSLPSYPMDIITTIGDVTIPLSMIVVGVQLGSSRFGEIFSNKDILATAFIKLIVAPAFVMLALMPVPVAPIVKLATVLGTCFPSAVIGVAMAVKENKNSYLMAEAVAATTLLSMITLPVWIVILDHMYM